MKKEEREMTQKLNNGEHVYYRRDITALDGIIFDIQTTNLYYISGETTQKIIEIIDRTKKQPPWPGNPIYKELSIIRRVKYNDKEHRPDMVVWDIQDFNTNERMGTVWKIWDEEFEEFSAPVIRIHDQWLLSKMLIKGTARIENFMESGPEIYKLLFKK